LTINPKNFAALTNKASALLNSGKFDDALDLVNQALDIKPEIAITWNTKGAIFTHLKKFQEALNCFDKAVSIDLNYSNAWFNKGYCIGKLEQIHDKRESKNRTLNGDNIVFISYADSDRESALNICNSLESYGIKCWLAFRDLKPATDWPSEIVKALRKCKFCLLIFSDAANKAKGVFNEISIAEKAKISIIPCRIENIEPSEFLEYHLSRRHYFDFFQGDPEINMKILTEKIKNDLQ
jgi:tetratricopeptide (TPR) repeat protein